ncbi:MAG TPA: hypothetical protein VGR84_17250 [Candidatus Acidoferrales bacterium]|nr:hypothetical protein [Candidatus Acidoferrales bacterium]
MFCPVCKYEYRRGFTHCNDCDVDLVDALPSEDEVDHKLRTPADELAQPTLLWKGASGGTFSAITAALDAAKIPYNREDLDARLTFSSEYSELEIWVPAANFSDAQAVLDEVLSTTANAPLPPDATNEIPAEDDEGADDIRHETLEELYPEDATAEVWSSNPASGAASDAPNKAASSGTISGALMADILKSCLAEIGVACYVARPGDEPDAGSGDAQPIYAVRVLPEDEACAKEIVRQVIDAAPPQ